MLNELVKSLRSRFDMKYLAVIVMFIAIGAALMYYSNDKNFSLERMELEQTNPVPSVIPAASPTPTPLATNATGYKQTPVANPSDLLPVDSNSQWGELNMLGNGGMSMPDLLQAGYHIGLDTIGQSLRNANLQERSDPIIPVVDTGPWNKSTIEPDYGRVPLEIGDCKR